VASKFHVTIVPVVGNAANAGDKWNPHTPEGRIQKELFGSDPAIDYFAATQPSPEVTRAMLGFVPGLNSALVFGDPKATTFDKTLAVGTDVLAVVGAGTVFKLGAKGVDLAKGVVLGAEAAEAAVAAEVGSGRAYSVLFEMHMDLPNAIGDGTRNFHNILANQALADGMAANAEFGASIRQFIPDIGASGRMTGTPGAGWTWHHAPETGVMQLVPTVQHMAPGPIQGLLHPFPTSVGPTGGGGFQVWGHLF
jgi:hypothetical protein